MDTETQEAPTPETPAAPPAEMQAPAPPLPKRRGRPPGSKNKPKDADGNPIETKTPDKPAAPAAPAEEWPPPNPAHVAFFQQNMLSGAHTLGANFGPHWAMQINPVTGDSRALTAEDFKMPAYAMAQIAGDKMANPWVILIGFAMVYAVPNVVLTVKMMQAAKAQEAANLESVQPTVSGAPGVRVGG